MTRETKIGLLVGLAFIIVIGILLSDHLSSATEPPQARLADVGNKVREGISTPGSANPPAAGVVTPPPAVAPQGQVPTREELTPQPQPVQIVQIGPSPSPAAQDSTPAAAINPPAAPQLAESTPVVITMPPPAASESPAAVSMAPAPGVEAQSQSHDSELDAIAKRYNEELVAVGSGAADRGNTVLASAGPAISAPRQYKAQPGDTLSKMAGRLMGANTRANREAIVRANPSLQANPNVVIEGRTYLIPATGEHVEAAVKAPQVAPTVTEPQAASQPRYSYTVRKNDTLWKIATEQLGTPAAVAAIKELNHDVLKGSDTVRPDMKLTLPARPVASVQ